MSESVAKVSQEEAIPNHKLFTKNTVYTKIKDPLRSINLNEIWYTNLPLLTKFVTLEKGKIIPSRMSGISSKNQRKISRAIKHARQLLLLP